MNDISVIVPAKNESLNIEACLQSVGWADQVFVVDSQSTDGTIEKAESLGAEVVQFHYDGGWPKKKNWAIKNLPIRNSWILILDADERISDSLKEEICKAVTREDIEGYYLRWKFMFLNKWQRHSWSHGWMLRLFRNGVGEYEDLGMRNEGGWDNEVHENIIVAGKTVCLKEYLVHETREDLSHWIAKQNQFSSWNAVRRARQHEEPQPSLADLWGSDPLKRRRFLKRFYLRLPFKPLIMFFYLYFFKLGILDGLAGYYFCWLRAVHELNIDAKIYEMKIREKDRAKN